MSPLYTRTGDQGTTSLADGTRVSKTELRFEAIGTIDELNTHIGLAVAQLRGERHGPTPESEQIQSLRPLVGQALEAVQSDLFVFGAYLARPDHPDISPLSDVRISELEQQIDHWTTSVPTLKNFILPGGSQASAQLHIVRTICRRAERTVVRYHDQTPIAEGLLRYINRLADYFFAAARYVAWLDHAPEQRWQAPQL